MYTDRASQTILVLLGMGVKHGVKHIAFVEG
jgi:hypothetical protein